MQNTMKRHEVQYFYQRVGLSDSAIQSRMLQADMLIHQNPERSIQKSGGGVVFSDGAYPLIAQDSREYMAFSKLLLQDADSYAFNIPSSGIPQPLTTIWTTRSIQQVFKMMTLGKLAGSWQQGAPGVTDIKIPTIAFAGYPAPYNDFTAGGNTSNNYDWVSRQIGYFEQFLEYGDMQQAQFGLAKIPYVENLREGMAITVSQFQNDLGFHGYDGIPNTSQPQLWGIINEPNLNPAITLPADGQEINPLSPSIQWNSKNFNQICRDTRLLINEVITNSQGNATIDSRFILAIPPSASTSLSTPNAIASVSVRDYLKETYPNIEIVVVPNFEPELVISGVQTNDTIAMVLFQHPNGEMPYDELFVTKWQGHRPVVTHSAISEKISFGLGGCILKYPFLVGYAYGV